MRPAQRRRAAEHREVQHHRLHVLQLLEALAARLDRLDPECREDERRVGVGGDEGMLAVPSAPSVAGNRPVPIPCARGV